MNDRELDKNNKFLLLLQTIAFFLTNRFSDCISYIISLIEKLIEDLCNLILCDKHNSLTGNKYENIQFTFTF